MENNEVTVLVNAAERGDTIDKAKAQAAFTEAEAKFNQSQQSDDRSVRIQATQAYKRARARLQAAGGTA